MRSYRPLHVDRLTLVGASLCMIVAVAMASWAVFGGRDSTTLPPTAPPPVGYGYWHASGNVIEDSLNRPLRIAAVTWFGTESTTWVPGGLDFQPYWKIENLVKKLGYNAIRLTFSNQLLEQNPIVGGWVRANPQFRGKHAWSIINAIVNHAGQIGLKIIFDDQRSSAALAKRNHVGSLDEPLWYTKQYPRSAWLHDWETLARRYLGNSTVVGFDLRNEPHTSKGPWSVKSYLRRGATWGPYQGRENPATDWRLAAETAGNAVLRINPHLLIFVEGVQLYPLSALPTNHSAMKQAGLVQPLPTQLKALKQGKVDAYWWGGVLAQVRRYPVRLIYPAQLVYSPHEYGPHKTHPPWFRRKLTFTALKRILYTQWGFIAQSPRSSYYGPVFIGETGTCTNNPICIAKQAPGNQATWLHLFVKYLQQHQTVGWSIWALNGSNAIDSPANDGLLNKHWNGVQVPELQRLFASVQH